MRNYQERICRSLRHQIKGLFRKEQGTRYKEQGTRNKVQGTRYKEQGTRSQGSRFRNYICVRQRLI
ncbi:MAG: hypothetical protein E6H06_08975 [Bacteroidetes bacterium]|nr:MAG: hypothetical protein E6H06_08975 [Bacteroidota bacterium]